MQFPMSTTVKRVAFVSVPITLLCLIFAFFLMLASFKVSSNCGGGVADKLSFSTNISLLLFSGQADNIVHNWAQSTSIPFAHVACYLPSIIYSVIVLLLNQYYMRLAHFLSEWENHR